MAVHRAPFDSLRFSGAEARKLGWALAISLAVHLLIWGGYDLGRDLGLWQRLAWPAWLGAVKKPTPSAARLSARNTEPPLVFVDVSPQQASPAPPQQTRYYSDRNSRAANPDIRFHSHQPKLNGRQRDVPKTQTVPRPNINQLQPAPAPTPAKPAPAPSTPQLALGDLTLARPQPVSPTQHPKTRPRTLREARAHQGASAIPGVAMQEPGGVRRFALQPSFDVRATPFGAYDRAFIEAVSARWYGLLDSQQFALDRTGKVVLRFHLNYDGSISDMKMVKNTVGELLGYVCQKAVEDPAPYAKWSNSMRLEVGKDYRDVTFTFYYY